MTRMRLNLLLRSGVLLGLALGVAWLVYRSPSERGKTSDTPLTDLSKPAVDSAAESFQTPTPKKKPAHVATEASATSRVEPPDDPDDAREWARQNPEDASAWLSNAPAGPKRDTVAEMVCAQLAQTDPAQAVTLAEHYAGGCSNLLENLVHQWADQDEPAARDYALNRPAGEERDRLLGRVAFVLSKENPAEAARLVAEQISPGEIQNEAAISVLHQWLLRDTYSAAAWAQLFSASPIRERALKEAENVSVSAIPVGN
jgi:hypothetical protein